jgi:hypothetical protein
MNEGGDTSPLPEVKKYKNIVQSEPYKREPITAVELN